MHTRHSRTCVPCTCAYDMRQAEAEEFAKSEGWAADSLEQVALKVRTQLPCPP